MLADNIFYLGIRHHGPGSAHSVLRALNHFAPDKILLEGPPEAAPLLAHLQNPDLQPPVAQLFYASDNPAEAVFYPFTRFSPEWQTLQYAVAANIPLEFFDLPQAHSLALKRAEAAATPDDDEAIDSLQLPADPLDLLAHTAGFDDGEQWWEQMVEQHPHEGEVFAAIAEAMSAVRSAIASERTISQREQYREAWMRQTIRKARKDGFAKIAVVCGAWHVPALLENIAAKTDTALLKGLPKTKISATWIPWTYSRISYHSGYGAGVNSPGWYDFLWEHGQQSPPVYSVSGGWITRAARLLREQGLDISPASVIDAVRLADNLAILRGRHPPNPSDMQEAMQTLFGLGDATALQLLDARLWVGERLGQVPDELPQTPLQQDFNQQLKSVRLAKEAVEKIIELDLRTDAGRNRSVLLYRLQILGLPWGRNVGSRSKGTFKESWQIQWLPEFELALIEKNLWGTTLATAAEVFAIADLQKADTLTAILSGLQRLLLADLPNAVRLALDILHNRAATTQHIDELLAALPGLVQIVRYGDVRGTDNAALQHLVESLAVRINIGLNNHCRQVDADNARQLVTALASVNNALQVLDNPELLDAWRQVLLRLADSDGIHAVIAGKAYRLLANAHTVSPETVANALSLALSRAQDPAQDPAQAADWLEGLLAGAGLALLHDETLLAVLDAYVCGLSPERFDAITPLLRRTFSTFALGERRGLLDKIRHSNLVADTPPENDAFDHELAALALPLLDVILGVGGEGVVSGN